MFHTKGKKDIHRFINMTILCKVGVSTIFTKLWKTNYILHFKTESYDPTFLLKHEQKPAIKYTKWYITRQKHEGDKQSHEGQEPCDSQHYEGNRSQEGEVEDSEDDICKGSWAAAYSAFWVLLLCYVFHGWKLRHRLVVFVYCILEIERGLGNLLIL